MTQEEKAKAYDEVLEQLRAMMPNWENLSYNGKTFLQDLVHIIPELKESEDEKIRKELIAVVNDLILPDEQQSRFVAWLEKQGEQNTVDKVEPKFKVGDWISSPLLGTARIIGVNVSNYQLEYIDGKQDFSNIDYVNYAYDKWTTKDAKYGDVLVDKYGSIGIYQTHNNEYEWCSYCSYIANRKLVSFNVNHYIPESYPATKEQRDTLEKAMTDAGWKFDFEKKELKKIEQKSS